MKDCSFGLSSFERALLLLCAGVELDSTLGELCSQIQGSAAPTLALALGCLPDPHWSALTPAAPLRHWQLIEVGPGDTLMGSPLRIDERILHGLGGIHGLDSSLHPLITPLGDPRTPPPPLLPSHQGLAQEIHQRWLHQAQQGEPLALVQLSSAQGQGELGLAIARWVGHDLGLPLYRLWPSLVPTASVDLARLCHRWQREVRLTQAALVVDWEEGAPGESARGEGVRYLLEAVTGPIFLLSGDRLPPLQRPRLTLEVPLPTLGEQQTLWHQALSPWVPTADLADVKPLVATLTAHFHLTPTAIQAAAQQAQSRWATTSQEPEDLPPLLWDSCRHQVRPRLEELAHRVTGRAAWQDLVLPPAQMGILRQTVAHVRQRSRVYHEWGFDHRTGRGLGLSALFAGVSGTGKTTAAEVLAQELHLDLYRIDLSAMVSKYIGETEKNLRRVFDGAEGGGVILLFDEADALFGKRSEVKDARDRYANLEVSYLLQRLETYQGLSILTSNLKNALDPAFLRRLRFVVQFPFPDATQRAEIWQRVFPPATPTEGLDMARRARLNVAGGNIHNIALGAAFLAAEAGEAVTMAHILEAAKGEYAKLERPLTDSEIRG